MKVCYTTKETRARDKKFLPLLRERFFVDPNKGYVFSKKTGKRVGKPRTSNSYGGIGIRIGDTVHFFNTHRVIWLLCVGLVPIGYTINHKDGIKSNAKLKNLECITDQENRDHASRTNLTASILTPKDVRYIRKSFVGKKKNVRNFKIMGARLKVSRWAIRKVVLNITHKHVV